MGPESIIGAIAGAMAGKLQLQTLFAIGAIAIVWLLYRDLIWKKIK
jgi:hypothetical protein